MTESEFYDLLADALQGMVRDGVRVKSIADQTGLSSSTLYKFMSKQTTYPRLHTAFAVLGYFGYTVEVKTHAKNRRTMPLVRDISKSTVKAEMH